MVVTDCEECQDVGVGGGQLEGGEEESEEKELVEEEVVPVMRVKALSGGQDAGSWQLKVNLKAEYLPLPESLGAADKPLVGLSQEEEALYQRLVPRVGKVTTGTDLDQVPLGNPNLLQ